MNIVVGVITIFLVSFFWAYLSLRKELNRQEKKEQYDKPKISYSQNDEIVLFDRTKKK